MIGTKTQAVVITIGLPASGKSTWAKDWISNHDNFIRVNKDDVRNMLNNGEYSPENEELVKTVRDSVGR